MSIPSRTDAARILLRFDPADRFIAHSSAVVEIASFLAHAIERRGSIIDVGLVEAAALLHDVDKLLPRDHPLKVLGHGEAGAAWLRENGHPELAAAVAGHPVTTLADDQKYRYWADSASLEDKVVAYADKRAIQDLVSLDDRFARWQARHPDSRTLGLARERAGRLEDEICRAAGVEPDKIARAPWVASVLRSAA